mmetsp:Transcript_27790/g.74851  ORF Transcript_27790/g.74851 Transcript_27790/m.74851 type:complete len:213 (-) Transcript_27790:650-1288(-)
MGGGGSSPARSPPGMAASVPAKMSCSGAGPADPCRLSVLGSMPRDAIAAARPGDEGGDGWPVRKPMDTRSRSEARELTWLECVGSDSSLMLSCTGRPPVEGPGGGGAPWCAYVFFVDGRIRSIQLGPPGWGGAPMDCSPSQRAGGGLYDFSMMSEEGGLRLSSAAACEGGGYETGGAAGAGAGRADVAAAALADALGLLRTSMGAEKRGTTA